MESFAVGEPSTLSNTLLEVEPSQGRAMTPLISYGSSFRASLPNRFTHPFSLNPSLNLPSELPHQAVNATRSHLDAVSAPVGFAAVLARPRGTHLHSAAEWISRFHPQKFLLPEKEIPGCVQAPVNNGNPLGNPIQRPNNRLERVQRLFRQPAWCENPDGKDR